MTVLLRALRHISQVPPRLFSRPREKRLTLHLTVVYDLAGTYGENAVAVYKRLSRALAHTGTLVEEATDDELRRYTLAYYGFA